MAKITLGLARWGETFIVLLIFHDYDSAICNVISGDGVSEAG